MANIKRNIRYYQPNDPYYWEVDNLPITDLLSNDVILENRLTQLESYLGGIGGADSSGSISLNAIADLKAYCTPLSGLAANFGQVFVRPGKFISRMQLPATRDSGWRMARDAAIHFNNENFLHPGQDMLSTGDDSPAIRQSHAVARTALCEFYSNVDGSDRSISIASFDAEDFNGGSAPSERLDLIYIKGTKALDTDGDPPSLIAQQPYYQQNNIPACGLGVIKGAYFRTDAAGGLHTNGTRFLNPLSRSQGRTTGMGLGDLPVSTNLPGFGTVPMPDDLVNFAWHSSGQISPHMNAMLQVDTQAAFSVPVAYVRVPSNYTAGDPISPENIIDIRPFFRSAELTGSERQGVAMSEDPHGLNPFVTQSHLSRVAGPGSNLSNQVGINTGNIDTLSGVTGLHTSQISDITSYVDALEDSVSGTGDIATPTSLNHEGRIHALETSPGGGGGGGGASDQLKFFAVPLTLRNNSIASTTTDSPIVILDLPQGDAANVTAIQLTLTATSQNTDGNTSRVDMQGGVQNMHEVARYGAPHSSTASNDPLAGATITWMQSVTPYIYQGNINAALLVWSIFGSDQVSWSLKATAYIVRS